MPMWNWEGHMGWGWMGIVWLLVIVFLVVVVGLTIVVLRRNERPSSTENPEQDLKRRYAKGEMDRETYQRILEDLRK